MGNFAGLLVERTYMFLHILLRECYGSSAGYSIDLGSKVLSVDGTWELGLRRWERTWTNAIERTWINANFILKMLG